GGEVADGARIVAQLHGARGGELQQRRVVRVAGQREVQVFQRLDVVALTAVRERDGPVDCGQFRMRGEDVQVFGARLRVLPVLEERLRPGQQFRAVVAFELNVQRVLLVLERDVLPPRDEDRRLNLDAPLARLDVLRRELAA